MDSESSTGLLNLTPEVLERLKGKHPEEADIADESLLYGPIDYIPPGVFDLIDEILIFDAATTTKGSAGPSGMDAELYRRILCSKNVKAEGKVLREETAVFTRNLLKIAYITIHLCWKAIPLADSSPWTKTLEYDLLASVRS